MILCLFIRLADVPSYHAEGWDVRVLWRGAHGYYSALATYDPARWAA